MRAFAVDEFGATGSTRDVPEPEAGEGQVRVRIVAAGLNPFDASVVQGSVKDYMEHRFPLIPGMDGSGVVDAVGPGVEGLGVGDEVFGSVGKAFMGEGTLAELVAMTTGTIARKPAGLDHPSAAAIPVAGVTALQMVEAMAPGEGDVVVAVGATGGVGSYLVQLAAGRGARVVAVCSAANAAYARRLGAVDVVDYTAGDVAEAIGSRYPDGVHAIADMAGDGEGLASLTGRVRPGGRFVSAVGSADVEALAAKEITGTNMQGRVNTAALETLAGMLEQREIKDPEIRTLSLDQADEAMAAVASHHTRGKLVVLP